MAKLSCAYCKAHRCYLTVKQLRLHKCLRKNCTSLQPIVHPYWKIREENKAKSAERRKSLYGSITDSKQNITNTEL